MIPVLKIAKEGYNAETETDLRNFKFHSGHGVPMIHNQADVSLVYPGNGIDEFTTTAEYTHNLGYVPVVFVKCLTTGLQIPYHYYFGGGTYTVHTYKVTSTKVIVVVTGNDGAGETLDFRIQILKNKIY